MLVRSAAGVVELTSVTQGSLRLWAGMVNSSMDSVTLCLLPPSVSG